MCEVFHYDNGDVCLKDKSSTLIYIKKANIPSIIEELNKSSLTNDEYTDSFNEFWNLYPKKHGKAVCLKKWLSIKPSKELFAIICSAIISQKDTEQWQKNNGMFIPLPSTWLNQERWNDEVDIKINIVNEMAKSDW